MQTWKMMSQQPLTRERLIRGACALIGALLILRLLYFLADYTIVRRDSLLRADRVVWQSDYFYNCSPSREEWEQVVRKQFPESTENGFGSHQVSLFAAAYVTSGAVLEMGSGFYSTPMLDALCRERGRYLLSTDTDMEWLGKFEKYRSERHDLLHITKTSDWDKIDKSRNWGVVFVDHKPGERRVVDIRRLADSADLLVVHDTETASYGYEPAFRGFRAQYTDTHHSTYTTVISNRRPDLVGQVARLTEIAYRVLP